MKKVNLLVTLLGLCLMMSSCVTLRGGVAVGRESYNVDYIDLSISPNHTDVPTQKSANAAVPSTRSNSNVGFYVGVGLTGVDIAEKFSFAPEINFISATKDLDQIQVPVLVRYEIIDKLSAHAGPAVGFFLNSPEDSKSTIFGFDLGVGYEIMDQLSVQARFDLGVSNFAESDYGKWRYSTMQFGVTYQF
ncbi:PorT family protein [Flavobacteriaceae bacterium F08102]|nr:PorT family protein [Flavobacteriaceae bacterium F08102]